MTQQQGPMGPFCQSCGMPLSKPDDFGTNAEGWRQNDYCHYCYQDGKFTQPDITLAEMIKQVVKPAAQATGMTEAEARAMAEENLPRLRRWQ
jgi:hypothetical protein